ncbi:alpha/beta fold hydrolase [Paraburkholderia humisilvae]|uniref:Non-heme bromoperoxidase BpoC n=1 Tax=Paraburkholderia humisilvae TaxID=627669 RepID=A0A6J5F8Z8_9BURK|nr:alpha/beta hydrolase [Paraburkholderia humisilvae]CAB3774964.1 Putative non-heme bromoperoxidase BpoC [Paraburkholderia humisilvae]
MAIAEINSANFYYEIRGDGPPLILIAGYTWDHTFWDQMVPTLEKNFRIVTFDNRGIGRTLDDGRPFSIHTMAADVAALIDYLGLSHVNVMAQSMGGAIAQTMFTQFPDSCEKCIILNSTQIFSLGAIKSLEYLLELRKAGVDSGFQENAALRLLAGLTWQTMPMNITKFMAELSDNPVQQSVADQERQIEALKSFDARQLNLPRRHATLVVSAIEDLLTPPREGKELATSLGAKYVAIPGGHPSPIEQPNCVVELCLSFLRRGN